MGKGKPANRARIAKAKANAPKLKPEAKPSKRSYAQVVKDGKAKAEGTTTRAKGTAKKGEKATFNPAAAAPMDTSDSELDALANLAKEEAPSTPKAAKGLEVNAEPFTPVDVTTPIASDASLEAIRNELLSAFNAAVEKHQANPVMAAGVNEVTAAVLAKALLSELNSRVEQVRSLAIRDTKSLEKGQTVDFDLCGMLSSPAKNVAAITSSVAPIADEATAAGSPADLKKLAVDHGLSKKAANSKSFYLKLNAASQRYDNVAAAYVKAGDWPKVVQTMQRKAAFVREVQGFNALTDRLGFKKALELQLSRGNTDFGGITDAEYDTIQSLAAKGEYAKAVKEVIAPKLRPSKKKAGKKSRKGGSSSESKVEGGAAAVCGYCGKSGHAMISCYKWKQANKHNKPPK